MNKLKNLKQNVFIKGIKVAALSALVLGATACNNNAGGNEKPNKKPDYEQPADEQLQTYIFDRPQFVKPNESFLALDTDQRVTFGNRVYHDIIGTMNGKLAALQQLAHTQNNSQLQTIVDNMVNNNNTLNASASNNYLDASLRQWHNDMAKFMAVIYYHLTAEEQNHLLACCDRMTIRNYEDNLGNKQNNKDSLIAFTKNLPNIQQRLAKYGISDEPNAIEDKIISILDNVAPVLGVDTALLKAGVNIRCTAVAAHGARDLTGYAKGITGEPIYQPPGSYSPVNVGYFDTTAFNTTINSELTKLELANTNAMSMGR